MPTLYTHASIFHADEVIGAGLLVYLGEISGTADIRRVNDLPAPGPLPGDFVVDIGLRLGADESGVTWLDHHQDKALPCAAVLVYRHFESRWTKPQRRAIERFLDGVDKHDRGLVGHTQGTMTLSDIVATLNPVGEATEEQRTANFREAVELFVGMLRRMVAFQELVEAQAGQVAELAALNTPFVVSETFLPKLLRALEGTLTRHAAYPSLRGGWCLQAVSLPGTKTPVQPIPADIAGATFVHPTGFIASFPTRELAIAAAEALAAIEVFTPCLAPPKTKSSTEAAFDRPPPTPGTPGRLTPHDRTAHRQGVPLARPGPNRTPEETPVLAFTTARDIATGPPPKELITQIV